MQQQQHGQMHSQLPTSMPNQSVPSGQQPGTIGGPNSQQQQQPGGPMYRGSYPSPQHPSSQPSMSPGMSPRPMSPASSASPVPGSTGKSIHSGGGNTGSQPNSSLQQLEQMVMPGAKDASAQMLPQGNVGLQQQQPPPKTPKSPSMRGHTTPLSPQQWPQQQQQQSSSSRPRSQSGKDPSASLPPPGSAKGMGPQNMMHMAPNGPMGSMPGMHPGMMDPQQQAMMGHPGMHPGMYMNPGGQQGMRMMSPHPGMQPQQQQQQHPMGNVRAPMGSQVPGGNAQMLQQQQGYHNMPSHMMSNQYAAAAATTPHVITATTTRL